MHRLRLTNTRNLLTAYLLRALLVLQRTYLESGNPTHLRPLRLIDLTDQLNGDSCPVTPDPSRLSRLLRSSSVLLPDGEVRSLSFLCPLQRVVHRASVAQIIRDEQARLVQSPASPILNDREIAAAAERHFGFILSPRTIAYLRKELGIPSFRMRRKGIGYVGATCGFSHLLPLERPTISTVPRTPGVYELRMPVSEVERTDDPDCRVGEPSTGVIYIGSAGDLRKRLFDHIRGGHTNSCLTCHRERGGMRFRYRPVSEQWRAEERRVYRAFVESFGAPPVCNHMSP